MAQPSRARSIPHSTFTVQLARTLASRPVVVAAIRSAVAVTGAGVLLTSIANILETPPSSSRLVMLAVLAVAVVGAECGAVRLRDGSAITVTFALLIAAQLGFGLPAAVLLSLLSVVVDAVLSPQPFPAVTERAALLAGLLAAGEVFARAGDPWQRIGMVVWSAIFVYWIQRSRRHGDRVLLASGTLALAWVAFVASYGLWPAPAALDRAMLAIAPALTRAAGFMTADTLVTVGLISGVGALGVLGGWRGRLLPTFYRYNGLSLAGFGLVEWERRAGVTGIVAGATILVALSFAWSLSARRQEGLVATICALTSALDARDSYTRGHSDRVAAYSVAIADQLGWGRRQRRSLELAAHLHDVGKIGVPDAVLLKPGRFTPDERALMETHALRSWEIVRNVPDLRTVADVLRQHHERLDGSGYPDGIAGGAITPAGRILAVADVYDALTSDRPYRAGLPPDSALAELRRGAGSAFDPEIVRAVETLTEADRLQGALRYSYCLAH